MTWLKNILSLVGLGGRSREAYNVDIIADSNKNKKIGVDANRLVADPDKISCIRIDSSMRILPSSFSDTEVGVVYTNVIGHRFAVNYVEEYMKYKCTGRSISGVNVFWITSDMREMKRVVPTRYGSCIITYINMRSRCIRDIEMIARMIESLVVIDNLHMTLDPDVNDSISSFLNNLNKFHKRMKMSILICSGPSQDSIDAFSGQYVSDFTALKRLADFIVVNPGEHGKIKTEMLISSHAKISQRDIDDIMLGNPDYIYVRVAEPKLIIYSIR